MLDDAMKLWTANWRVGLDAAGMGLASAEVIAARLPMIAAAARGSRAHDAELARMVGEKIAASAAATLGFWTAWAQAAGATAPSLSRGSMAATRATLDPFHRRATANARRLKRRKRR